MTPLTDVEMDRLEKKRKLDTSADATLDQLDRILASPRFLRCHENARSVLAHIVQMSILGEPIKETTIASRIFGHAADGVVRQCAHSLRNRLASYYGDEGRSDPIRITIPPGGYAPQIDDTRLSVLVATMENWSLSSEQDRVSDAITDEVLRILRQNPQLVVREVSTLSGKPRTARGGVRAALMWCGDKEVRLSYCIFNFLKESVTTGQLIAERKEALVLADQLADLVLRNLVDPSVDTNFAPSLAGKPLRKPPTRTRKSALSGAA